MIIWHNSRCTKSRQTLALIEDSGIKPQIIDYQDTPPKIEEIRAALKSLGISARELMRTGEDIYKELGLGQIDDEETLIQAMYDHPKLIERPVVLSKGKAIIGRPPENVLSLLK